MRPNFTLSPGLRYENQNNIDSNFNFAPRIAFAWSPVFGRRKHRPNQRQRRRSQQHRTLLHCACSLHLLLLLRLLLLLVHPRPSSEAAWESSTTASRKTSRYRQLDSMEPISNSFWSPTHCAGSVSSSCLRSTCWTLLHNHKSVALFRTISLRRAPCASCSPSNVNSQERQTLIHLHALSYEPHPARGQYQRAARRNIYSRPAKQRRAAARRRRR